MIGRLARLVIDRHKPHWVLQNEFGFSKEEIEKAYSRDPNLVDLIALFRSTNVIKSRQLGESWPDIGREFDNTRFDQSPETPYNH